MTCSSNGFRPQDRLRRYGRRNPGSTPRAIGNSLSSFRRRLRVQVNLMPLHTSGIFVSILAARIALSEVVS